MDDARDAAGLRPMTPDEAAIGAERLAINLARTSGYHVFPVRDDKKPATLRGFKDASADPRRISELWLRHPARLIGIATGSVSGIDVLDIDEKHDAARAWWHDNISRRPVTRTFRTRSGGLHLYFRHAESVGCTTGKIAQGIDTRGDGGYIIYWFAAGLECLDHSPIAPWPEWLLGQIRDREPVRPAPRGGRAVHHADAAIDGALRMVANAAEGERNAVLHWAACRFGEHVRAGRLSSHKAEALLVAAGVSAGLPEHEARATARSGLRRAA